VTPLACGVEESWKKLIAGESGLSSITRFDASDLPAQVAGEVPTGEGEGEFNVNDWVTPKDQKKMDLFIHYAMAAAKQALNDADWAPESEEDQHNSGVLVGSGIGGLPEIERGVKTVMERGPKRLSPFFIPACLINLASGQISMACNLKGPNHSVVTACSTGAHAIGDAADIISRGDAKIMVAGGAESALCHIGVAGFASARALSTSYNDTPEKASRPWDVNRDGFVMGEGAGLVVLEEYEHAKARGAKIYAEVVGYGLSGDAYHMTSPEPEGDGGFRAMQMALKKSGLSAEDIDYINAHGTSTPAGDMIEVKAVKRLFGDHAEKLSMSSTKSSIGHLLGAAGSVEAIFCILAMRDQIAPPTLNLEEPDEATAGMDLVPLKAKKREINAVLSNSFGFGGTNASVIFKKAE
jgi:3-oxoacyl-[acyl-carrier-protein] synthase II